MKRFLSVSAVAMLALCVTVQASVQGTDSKDLEKKTPYRLIVKKNERQVEYRVNDFYSVYYIYFKTVLALGLDERLGEKDIRDIVCAVIDNLKQGNDVQLQVDCVPDDVRRITLRSDLVNKEPVLWIVSNYNQRTQRTVTWDGIKDAYGIFLAIRGDKLVCGQCGIRGKNEEDLKALSVNDRADVYLMDGDPENDREGKDLIVREVAKTKKPVERVLLHMTLSEYCLLSGNTVASRECLSKARKELSTFKDGAARRNLEKVLGYAEIVHKCYDEYARTRKNK
jgi:hypothetical protein